ncbi:uncharacterized protein LOC119104095 [Pollicipes pollicipes]|uniref:uncharacterized protein LOC119104095 n=1 Tax=Pollicipes pollicipes TaxID=41117 RepID=UPI0018854758|nr:uncharacterized protein LOC119104095 [Pollicipes pollicipes]
MSVMSDMLSDSDSYVLLNLEFDKSESVDPLFVVEGALKRVPSVEIASEVTEDTHSEVSLSSAMRKRDVLHLERIKLRLTEDRPPNNITSPGVVPLDLRLPAVHVTRNGAGVFTVQQPTPGGAGAGTGPSGSCSLVDVASSFNNPASGSEGELGRLRRRCQLLEDQLEQRRGSEQRLSQLTALEARCREAEDEVLGLREEKEVLMKTLSYLKQEFLRLDTAHSRRTDAK